MGSRATDKREILFRVEKMLDEGMDILDLGAASSRPGAAILSSDEELSRLMPAIEAVLSAFPDLPISVDTLHWKVADQVVSAGAAMINDISGGLYDPEMLTGISKLEVAYCCMHMKGTPETMNSMAIYEDVLIEVIDYFTDRPLQRPRNHRSDSGSRVRVRKDFRSQLSLTQEFGTSLFLRSSCAHGDLQKADDLRQFEH